MHIFNRSIAFKNKLRDYLFILLIIILGVSVRLRNIDKPLIDTHDFRQAQTATVTRNFYTDGIDIFKSKLDILGTGKEQVLILEFPIYQAVVASLSHLIGYSDKLGKIVSIFFGVTSGLILMKIIIDHTGNRNLGFISLVFFLFAPLNIFFQQAFMIESMVIWLHLFSIWLWISYFKSAEFIYLISAIIVTSLGFITKSVYMIFPFGIIAVLFMIYPGKKKIKIVPTIISLFIPLLVLFVWQIYSDNINIQNGNYFFASSSNGLKQWIFGSVADRMSLKEWGYRVKLLFQGMGLLGLFFSIMGVLEIYINKNNKLNLIIWCSIIPLYMIIFFGVINQNYYFLPAMPVLAILSATGLLYVEKYLHGKNGKLGSIIIFGAVLLVVINGTMESKKLFVLDWKTYYKIEHVKSNLFEKGPVLLLFDQWDWNSVYTYYLNRKALVIRPEDLGRLDDLRKQGYIYLISFTADIKNNTNKLINYIPENDFPEDGLKIYKL